MRIRVSVAALPKGGNSAEEYEDACAPGAGYQTEAWRFRAAVSDGATETSHSGEWARELVAGYRSGRLRINRLPETLVPLQRRWRARVGQRPLPWYAQEKLRQGAFSSLLGLTVGDASMIQQNTRTASETSRTWTCAAVGDSCLFIFRRNRLLSTFPMVTSAEFSNHPRLISSLPAANAELPANLLTTGGRWEPGDTFLLATDALACWLLRTFEEGDDGFAGLAAATACDRRFAEFMGALRAAGEMRNDDVTALLLRVDEGPRP